MLGDFVDTKILKVQKVTKIGFAIYLALFLISFIANFLVKGLEVSSPKTTLDYELITIGISLLASIMYFIAFIKFFKLLKLCENDKFKKLINIITILIILNFLTAFGESILELILSYIHFLRLTNYALFEEYIYILYFVKLIISLIYFILVLDLIYHSSIKQKLYLYVYIICFVVQFSLPYLYNDPTNNILEFIIALLSVMEIIMLLLFVKVTIIKLNEE
jgi:hypothetical protein